MKYDASKPLRKFERTGILAVRPQAFFDFFAEPASRASELVGDVELIDVCGPISQHDDYWTDSFDAILGRVVVACARQETKAIVLKLDSPGGDAQGCIDCARAIEAACAVAGKPLYAYVDGQACSAAYALACVAERIYIGTTSFAGSIGVALAREDVSARLAQNGVRVAVITSGARKLDGNPSQPITDDELRAQQELVDAMAGALFEHVAVNRGLPVEAVAAFDAKVFAGKSAIGAGLADEQAPMSVLLADIQTGVISMTAMDKARANLEEASKSDDAAVAKQARAALSAMDKKEEPAAADDAPPAQDEPDGDEPKEKPAAEGDDPPADDDEDKPKDKASARGVNATAFRAVTQALAQSQAEVRTLKAAQATRERAELIASRPDLPAELVATFERLELAEIKAIVKAVPKAKMPLKSVVTTVAVAQGKHTQGTPGRMLPPEQHAKLQARMGLVPAKPLVNKLIGNTVFVGVPEDYQLPSAVDEAKG
jgi:ClpP class serine protease